MATSMLFGAGLIGGVFGMAAHQILTNFFEVNPNSGGYLAIVLSAFVLGALLVW